MFGIWAKRKQRHELGRQMYEKVLGFARQPAFFGPGRVPDTVDGRFDLLSLHVFLVTRALRIANPKDRPDQWVFDAFFKDMDAAVREMGVGDTLVGKRIKRMAQAFYGRSARYLEALDTENISTLRDALATNLLATQTTPDPDFLDALTDWTMEQASRLAAQTQADMFANGPAFQGFSLPRNDPAPQ